MVKCNGEFQSHNWPDAIFAQVAHTESNNSGLTTQESPMSICEYSFLELPFYSISEIPSPRKRRLTVISIYNDLTITEKSNISKDTYICRSIVDVAHEHAKKIIAC